MTVILSKLSIVSIVIPYVRVCRSRRNPDDRAAECNFATHEKVTIDEAYTGGVSDCDGALRDAAPGIRTIRGNTRAAAADCGSGGAEPQDHGAGRRAFRATAGQP